MEPTLQDGDLLVVRLVRLVGRHPARVPLGGLVVVRLPGSRPVAVKRLTGRQDGGWWVERDNPAEGIDSWLVGAIPEPDLIGRVLFRIAPRPGRIAGRPPG